MDHGVVIFTAVGVLIFFHLRDNELINASIRQDISCCVLQSAYDYTFYLQDATTVILANIQ